MRAFLTFLSPPAGQLGLGSDPIVSQLIDTVSLTSDGTTLIIVFDDLEQDDTTNFEAQHSDNVTNWTVRSLPMAQTRIALAVS